MLAPSHLWSPFLCNGLGQSSDASLCQAVVGLTSIAVGARCTRDVDDATGFTILDSEVRGGLSDQPERGGVVDSENSIPLLIGDFMDDTIPGVASIVDDDVNLAIAKLGRLLHQDGEEVGVGDITSDSNGSARGGIVDRLGNAVGFGGVDVSDHDFGTFVGKEAGSFGADTLAGAGNLWLNKGVSFWQMDSVRRRMCWYLQLQPDPQGGPWGSSGATRPVELVATWLRRESGDPGVSEVVCDRWF